MVIRALVLALVVLATTAVHAQPSATPPGPYVPAGSADVLREGNTAATAGDWNRVSTLVDPLLQGQLPAADLAEAHRLAGLAAFFQGRRPAAEAHLLAYLRIDLDGQLDPALYPPEVVIFFNDVKAKHSAELRTRRPKAKRYWVLNLLPPAGQFQNGERVKGFVVGGLLAGFVVGNVTSFFVLRSWCTQVSGTSGTSYTCDESEDRHSGAAQVRAINIATGIGAILTYAYGVYDGGRGYRRGTRERSIQPFVTSTATSGFIGVAGSF